jgi:hypothetical protein
MASETVHGHGMYVDVDCMVGRPPADARKLLKCLTSEGRPITALEFEAMRSEAKAKGYKVFPQDACKNVGPTGRCAGCLVDESGNVIGPASGPAPAAGEG